MSLSKSQASITVAGLVFDVREHAGLVKADMSNFMGWTSVWADTREHLVTRVRAALRGNQ